MLRLTRCKQNGIPGVDIFAAVAYYDKAIAPQYRQLTLIQAQRDYFGAQAIIYKRVLIKKAFSIPNGWNNFCNCLSLGLIPGLFISILLIYRFA